MEIKFLVNFRRKIALYLPISSEGLYQLKINGREICIPIKALNLLGYRRFNGMISVTDSNHEVR